MDSVFVHIISAINSSLSPATGHDERQRIELYLQELKQRPEFVSFIAYVLATEHEMLTYSVRLLSLTLFQDWISNSWNRIQLNDQAVVMQSVLAAAQSTIVAESPKSFKVKLAAVIANIAVRQFPQLWMTFVEDMLGMVDSGKGAEVAVLVLNYTITDCIDNNLSSTLPSLRRQEVLGGIRTHMLRILTVAYQHMCRNMDLYLAAQQQGTLADPSDAPALHSMISLTQSMFQMMVAVVTFGKSIEICTSDHNFLALAVDVLQFSDFQLDGVTLLHAIVEQPLNIELTIRSMIKLCETPLGNLPFDQDEQQQILSNYVEGLHLLLSKNHAVIVSHVLERKRQGEASAAAEIAHIETALGSFCMLLLSQIRAPCSASINLSVLSDWHKICRDDSLYSCISWFDNVAVEVMKEYLHRMCLSLTMTSANSSYETEADWSDYNQTLTTSTLGLVAELCAKIPQQTLTTVTDWIKAALVSLPREPSTASGTSNGSNRGDSGPPSRRGLSRGKEAARYCRHPVTHAYNIVLNTTITQITLQTTKLVSLDNASSDPNVNSMRQQRAKQLQSMLLLTLEVFLNWNTPSIEQTLLKLKFISAFKSFVKPLIMEPLYPVLQRMFGSYFQALIVHQEPIQLAVSGNRVIEDLPNSGMDVAAVARDGIYSICVSLNEAANLNFGTMRFCEYILTEVEKVLAMNQYKDDVKFCCREIVIILYPALQDPDKQLQALVTVLDPLLTQWKAVIEHICTWKDPAMFISAILQHTHASSRGGKVHDDISQILSLLEGFYCLGKRVSLHEMLPKKAIEQISCYEELVNLMPFMNIWQDLLHGIMMLVQLLDSADTMEFQAKLQSEMTPEAAAEILLPTDHEIHRECGVSLASLRAGDATVDDEDFFIASGAPMTVNARVSLCLYSMRKQLLQLLGLSCMHRTLFYSPLFPNICEYFRVDFPNLHNIHISQLSHRVLLLFVAHLPRGMFHDLHGTRYRCGSAIITAAVQCLVDFLLSMNNRLHYIVHDAEFHKMNMQETAGHEFASYQQALLQYKYCNYETELRSDFSASSNTMGETSDSTGYSIYASPSRSQGASLYRRECMVTTLCRNYCDVVASMFDLGNSAKHHPPQDHHHQQQQQQQHPTTEDTQVDVEQSASSDNKKHPTLEIILTIPGCEPLADALFQSVTALLYVQDSVILRKVLAMVKVLLPRAAADHKCAEFVGRDVFQKLINLLLVELPWVAGLENDLTDLVSDIYCHLILAVSDDCPIPAKPSAAGLSALSTGSCRSIIGVGAAIAVEPRQVLMQLLSQWGDAGVIIESLERQLGAVVTSRKKCKDIMKTFLVQCRSMQSGNASKSASASSASSVQDIAWVRSREDRSSATPGNLSDAALEGGSLMSMFGDR